MGTVTLDPTIARSSDRGAIERAVGFTGYFRCSKCDAGGPWELPPETVLYITVIAMAASSGLEDVPLVIGCTATFDGQVFRYATESEAHLKELIEREPERAFLWTRLGNLYKQAGQAEWAETAYRRAIELDPDDFEAHGMFGQLLVETDRVLEAVPHWHAVLKQARNAHHVTKPLRREFVRGAISWLLEAHAQSNGQIDFMPAMDPGERKNGRDDQPAILELREFDLSTQEGLDDLCDAFTEPPQRDLRDLIRPRIRRMRDVSDDWHATPVRHTTPAVPRNAPCPCGSGHKYKKCCGRR